MILKGSQRAAGVDLATHLMNAVDNERIEIAEVSGTVAQDLHGAFAEFEAIAAGTKAREYLYSLSINPPSPLTRDQYNAAILAIEARLGLAGQPRAVVYHVKNGREHCHVVWSRIDVDTMRAVHLSHDRRKLCDLACELAGHFGLALPPGLQAWQAGRRHVKSAPEPTLAENAQAARTGVTPDRRRDEITTAYEAAQCAQSFRDALAKAGYVLAHGERRAFVVVDQFGHVHSLTRYVRGHSAKKIKARLGTTVPATLEPAAMAQDRMRARRAARAPPALCDRTKDDARRALQIRQAARRRPLEGRSQELLVRHASERLALHAAHQAERESRLRRAAAAVLRLLRRVPGLRSILSPFAYQLGRSRAERHAAEEKALARRHVRERATFDREERSMTAVEKRERQALELVFRRKAEDGGAHVPRHEEEDIHRLHAHLVAVRCDIEATKPLLQIFNARAGSAEDAPDPPAWSANGDPPGPQPDE